MHMSFICVKLAVNVLFYSKQFKATMLFQIYKSKCLAIVNFSETLVLSSFNTLKIQFVNTVCEVYKKMMYVSNLYMEK